MTLQPDEIVSIEKLDEQDTIDICVSGDNLFIANNILTHNSGVGANNPGLEMVSESMGLSMTADVMVSIFQSEEDREMGIIRFGMMKNRFGPRGMQQPMRIDYKTLSIEQSDCDMIGDDDTAYSTLALLED